jgi:hypothetical protein
MTASAPDGCNSRENIESCLNSERMKYCASFVDEHTCKFTFTKPITLVGYGMTTANDAYTRDPTHWTLRGRENSGSDFKTIHVGDDRDDYPEWDRFYNRRFTIE